MQVMFNLIGSFVEKVETPEIAFLNKKRKGA